MQMIAAVFLTCWLMEKSAQRATITCAIMIKQTCINLSLQSVGALLASVAVTSSIKLLPLPLDVTE